MKEETLIITSREQLTNCLTKVESLLNSFINQVYIKLEVSKELFEECLSLVVPKLNFSPSSFKLHHLNSFNGLLEVGFSGSVTTLL